MFVHTGEAACKLNSSVILLPTRTFGGQKLSLGILGCISMSHKPQKFCLPVGKLFSSKGHCVKRWDMMSRKSTGFGRTYLHLMQCLRCVSTLCCKTGRKKTAPEKSTSAPDVFRPDSKHLEFNSKSPVVFSAGFGSDGCTLNFQTAVSTAVSRGRWKVPVTAGMIQGTDGLCCAPALFVCGEGSGRMQS